jgi:hypothetical protein
VRIGVVRFILLVVGHAGLPNHFPVGAVKAHDGAPILLLNGLRDKHTLAPHDGRGVAAVGQRHAPTDVFVFVPLNRQDFSREKFHRCPDLASWASWPQLREREQGDQTSKRGIACGCALA